MRKFDIITHSNLEPLVETIEAEDLEQATRSALITYALNSPIEDIVPLLLQLDITVIHGNNE